MAPKFVSLVLGPMGSGKTSRLIRQYRQLQNVAYYKLSPNYSTEKPTPMMIRSHDSFYNVRGWVIGSLSQVSLVYPNLFIDEVQFCPREELRQFIEAYDGQLYLGGLDYDWRAQWFATTRYLVLDCLYINYIARLKAKCYACGAKAPYSKKLIPNHHRIEEGGLEMYKPACYDCYHSLLVS